MTTILKPHFGIPLEREYEGWIVHRIEKYFRHIGKSVHVWAVSPTDEATWPADEAMIVGGKLFGLQFKQPKLGTYAAGTSPDFSRLKWILTSPPGQAALVASNPEIYYCLPTFTNREWRRESLHHALFWHPTSSNLANPVDLNVWYENLSTKVKSKNNNIVRHPSCFRWGEFIERVLNCQLPDGFERTTPAHTVLQRIRRSYSEFMNIPKGERPDQQNQDSQDGSFETVLYLFYLPEEYFG